MATKKPSVIKKGMRNLSDGSSEVVYNPRNAIPKRE
jgi:hypothetical protein